jgi:hypothetical protein
VLQSGQAGQWGHVANLGVAEIEVCRLVRPASGARSCRFS